MQRRALGVIALALLVFGSMGTFTDVLGTEDAVVGVGPVADVDVVL